MIAMFASRLDFDSLICARSNPAAGALQDRWPAANAARAHAHETPPAKKI
jgi:hypothetical protein